MEELEHLRERVLKYEGFTARLKAALAKATSECKQSAARVQELQTAVASGDDGFGDGSVPPEVVGRLTVLSSSFAVVVCGDAARVIPDARLSASHPTLVDAALTAPSFVSPEEGAQLRARAREAAEELRAYRVRTEALLRQRESDLAAARERLLILQSQQVSGGSGEGEDEAEAEEAAMFSRRRQGSSSAAAGEDAGPSAKELQSQVTKLLRTRAELLERDRASQELITQLMRQGQGDETVDAAPAPRPAGQGRTTVAQLLSQAAAAPAASPPAASTPPGGAGAAADAAEKEALVAEYSAYRKRAVGLLREKEADIRRLSDDLESARLRTKAALTEASTGAPRSPTGKAGGADAEAPTSPVSSFLPSSRAGMGMLTPKGSPDIARAEYLRAALVRYLSASITDSSIKHQLESTLIMLLRLTPAEAAAVARAREEAAVLNTVHSVASGAVTAGGSVLSAAGIALGGLQQALHVPWGNGSSTMTRLR
jgi:hypothetical protein